MMDYRVVLDYTQALTDGLLLTVHISLLAFSFSFLLAVPLASARLSPYRILRFVSAAYIEIIRNTPFLLQLFVLYFALPAAGIALTSYQAGLVALSVNGAGYLAEIFRAGLASVPTGQREASWVLGMGGWTRFTTITFPFALRSVYPAMSNQFLLTMLASSLLSAIALPELTGSAMEINAMTFRSVEVFTVVTAMYLALSLSITLVLRKLAQRLFRERNSAISTDAFRIENAVTVGGRA
ncbi:amino acid ABC transporter permease [Rhodococcus opacus]|uniref:amino acid ABC transporter permease n=1 Tax=Rhodococcus opacus TaxID=37919 RepID=UPI000FFC7D4C|nr:amino acid ABC transporter permease [Rhodococcus opacus]